MNRRRYFVQTGHGERWEQDDVGLSFQSRHLSDVQFWPGRLLGRIIALGYREDHWPVERVAPYQVALDDVTPYFVPEDSDRCCRMARREDVRMSRRMDALAPLDPPFDDGHSGHESTHALGPSGDELDCSHRSHRTAQPGESYRSGHCQCCHPVLGVGRTWSYTASTTDVQSAMT